MLTWLRDTGEFVSKPGNIAIGILWKVAAAVAAVSQSEMLCFLRKATEFLNYIYRWLIYLSVPR